MRQLDYSRVSAALRGLSGPLFTHFVHSGLPAELSELWGRDYAQRTQDAEIVSVTLEGFSYLFDLSAERCVAAYGVMSGRNNIARDHARMAGFPKAEGKDYHRGHMIPHSGKGGTDINLFIQLGAVNIGRFRELEKAAVANPGAFYFVRLAYDAENTRQRPDFVEQGLVQPGGLVLRFFPN
jgi:hypothetical protein